MKKISSIIAVLLLLLCCKNKERSISESKSESVKEKNLNSVDNSADVFSLHLEVKVNKDETFRVYYGYIGEPFSDERVVIKNVVQSNKFQNIMFQFPENELPQQFRVHIGSNNLGDSISLGKIVFEYGTSKLSITPDEYPKYFINSPSMPYNESIHSFEPEKVGETVFDPHFLSNNELANRLIKMQ